MCAETAVEWAGLERLGDTPIDDVLALMEREVPDYRSLYYTWERQGWEAGALDLSHDREQWTDGALTEGQQRSFLWCLSSFYVGVEQVTEALVPFVDAAPSEEQQVFLTTQLADEARHTVFFDRFCEEVLDEGNDMRSRLDRRADNLNSGFRTVLLEMLPEAAAHIRAEPENPIRLIEGVVLCHIVIEGALALTGQRFLLNHLRSADLLPGFRSGFTAVARDETRHVGFGVRFLKEMIDGDGRYADAVGSVLARIAPIGLTVVEPPGGDMSYYEPLPYSPDDVRAFALNALDKRLKAIGVPLEGALA